MKRAIISIAIPALFLSLLSGGICLGEISKGELYQQPPQTDAIIKRGNEGQLPAPIITENSVEICLNSRYSQHSLSGTINNQQLANILWAAAQAPVIGTYRNIFVLTPAGTFLYDPNSHSLSHHSDERVDEGAVAIRYERQLDFDTGVSFMPAILAAVSLCNSPEPDVASCPKGLWHPNTFLYFGVQPVNELTTQLVAKCSVPEGQPGWLPDPNTNGVDSLEEVLADLNYIEHFSQTDLTLAQKGQLLWAGYGCSDHTAAGQAGLTVPSAFANYYLTGNVYLIDGSGVYRYHDRKAANALTTRDHRIQQIKSEDIRSTLRQAVTGLPEAPCYFVLCLDSTYLGEEFANLEVGFVASSMLMQATALELGCHFMTQLEPYEMNDIQTVMGIQPVDVPQAIVSAGAPLEEEPEEQPEM